jgi:hypothetical protein
MPRHSAWVEDVPDWVDEAFDMALVDGELLKHVPREVNGDLFPVRIVQGEEDWDLHSSTQDSLPAWED